MVDPFARKLADIVGGTSAKSLERAFGHRTVGDLLGHYPRRYAHRGELTDLAALREGDEVTVVATVKSSSTRRMRARKGSLEEVVITDGRGLLTLTFFNSHWRAEQLAPGKRGLFAGKVGAYRGGLQLAHPEYQLFDDDTAEMNAVERADWPIPVYPATGSLQSWKIGNAVRVALDTLPDALDDPVPETIAAVRGLMGFHQALEGIHRPHTDDDWRAAREALRYQEALVLQTALVRRRDQLRAAAATPRHAGALLAEFDGALAFSLTGDQAAAGETIAADLAATRPMNRLIQGEVGSGKTLVALRAMLAVAEPVGLAGAASGGQSVLLAPTEVLAQQHLRSIVASLGPDLAARLRPTLLTGKMPTADRKRALLAAASGQSRIVVGTHALFGEHVSFADLGLVVVDEQHRFGVEQRDALRAKGGETVPHLLVLTATPIPRTVAMTVFGDLDVTTIAELPAGRAPIESHVVPLAERPGWIARVWDRLAEEVAAGRQGFVVVPAIAESLVEDPTERGASVGEADASRPMSTVEGTLALLQAHPAFSALAVRALHGRMSPEEKDATMRAFAAGEIHVLVATTVIEVGVDVPNASAMVVLDAERFGVSQLHQLRGRVGRGGLPGLALFVTSAEEGSLARERVDAVAATLDGFVLAERDLALRHEGDVLGAAQSGRRSGLRLLSAATDGELIAAARDDAIAIIAGDPDLADHPALAAAIARRVDDEAAEFITRA
ncbi:MAG TPA: ATP-dependent DNA helicase RecG [Microbacteriaceae bacterium]|nr:ATP-dependent DNA helicase RecG [Microbacteriaceae bacterium]